jgi:prepilin signal peptidase PulO-like enzyme (type II secretory pathway)
LFALVLVLGLAIGYVMEKVSFELVRKRTDANVAQRISNGPLHTAIWMSTNCAVWLAIWRIGGISLYTVEVAIIASICIMLSAIDILIRKIPNELLAALFIVHLMALLLGKKYAELPAYLLGAAVGLILFLLPALFRKGGVGLGDVKLASAVGFILTTGEFFVSAVLMAVLLLIYTAYLLITGKGGFKSKVALGPFIAASLVAIMTFKALTSQGPLEYITRMLAG